VYTAIALLLCVELYRVTQSKLVLSVTVVHENEALGVLNPVVPLDVGAIQVNVVPPAE
jgi:hypothetical protein